MAKNELSYKQSVNLYALARELQEKYYMHLGYIDMDSIYFADKIGDKPVKASIVELSGIRSAWVKQILSNTSSNKLYCISAWFTEWSELPYVQQEWLMFDTLYSIGVENDGKIRGKDVFEHGVIAEYLGVYWRKNPDLPSLLNSPEPLPLPPPPSLHDDEGSTI